MTESTTTTSAKHDASERPKGRPLGINIRQLINDNRWQSRVGSILDIIAILKDIELRKQFINTQAIRANPLDVAVNLMMIHQEAAGMDKDIEKIRGRLYRLYEVSLQDIYSDYQENDEDDMDNGKNHHQAVKLPKPRKRRKAPRRMFRGGRKKHKSFSVPLGDSQKQAA